MPDYVTLHERQLIAEALASGKVTYCPPRTYAINLYETISPQELQSRQFANMARARRLREAEEMRARAGKPKQVKTAFSDDDRQARREIVKALADGKHSIVDIEAALSERGIPFTRDAISKDIQVLRAKGLVAGTSVVRAAVHEKIARRRATVEGLLAQGMSHSAMAAALGVDKTTVTNDVKFLRERGKANERKR